MIDLEYVRSQVTRRLPLRTRWLLDDIPLDTDLTRSLRPLQPLQASEVIGGLIDPRWTTLYLFGEQDYAEGGGASPFLGIDRHTGEVLGLDIERGPSALYFLNSDIDSFIKTFSILGAALRPGSVPSGNLSSTMTAADPHGYERSEWRFIVPDAPTRP